MASSHDILPTGGSSGANNGGGAAAREIVGADLLEKGDTVMLNLCGLIALALSF